MVAIPTGFLYQLQLLPGDHVELELDETLAGFFVRPLRRAAGRGVPSTSSAPPIASTP